MTKWLTWALALLVIPRTLPAQQCLGDFNGDQVVTVDEILTTVNNALNGCPTPGPRFVDNGDGTITDTSTQLMWEKKVQLDHTTNVANLQDADNVYPWAGTCSVSLSTYCQPTPQASAACTAGVEGDPMACGQCAAGAGVCRATTTVWTWLTALNAVSFGGHNDWRIPKRTELQGIVDDTATSPPEVDAAFQGTGCGASCGNIKSAACACTQPGYYWSSTPFANFSTSVWCVNFSDGYVGANIVNNSFYVRAVRGGS